MLCCGEDVRSFVSNDAARCKCTLEEQSRVAASAYLTTPHTTLTSGFWNQCCCPRLQDCHVEMRPTFFAFLDARRQVNTIETPPASGASKTTGVKRMPCRRYLAAVSWSFSWASRTLSASGWARSTDWGFWKPEARGDRKSPSFQCRTFSVTKAGTLWEFVGLRRAGGGLPLFSVDAP